MRGDVSGRVPFALVAVLLLMSAGISALYGTHLAAEDASRRAHEARLSALAQVADLVHEEMEAEAQHIAVRAIVAGIDGIVNESRIAEGFRAGFADYVAYHFPRVVRGVSVEVTEFGASIHLVTRTMDDLLPSNGTRTERYGGMTFTVPDLRSPETMASVDRLADYSIAGFANYSLDLDGTTLTRVARIRVAVPVPAPLIASKLEQADRSGLGDVSGVGATVKAIVAAVVQFRVLSGMASRMRPGTTTADVLTVDDVSLAVNLALLLEEVRLFRSFDRDAAEALDGLRGPLPPIPDDLAPGASERSVARLLDRYAANGTLDAVDLYALYTGLDAQGLSIAALLAQAIAAIADQIALKALDYFGLTPLFDFLFRVASAASGTLDGFLRWITGRPSAQVEYVHQYLRATFVETGFFGPTPAPIPERSYDVPGPSGPVGITVPAHPYLVPFPAKDLLSRDLDGFWQAYFPRFNATLSLVDQGLRGFVNDLAARIASNAVLAGLLPGGASGPIDPKDEASLLAVLADRVGRALDDAVAWIRSDPEAVQSLMTNLWESVRNVLEDLAEHMIASYDSVLAKRTDAIRSANDGLAADLYSRAGSDPDFGSLNQSQKAVLQSMVLADVRASPWMEGAYEARQREDADMWRIAVSEAGGEALRSQLLTAVLGAGGGLILARDSVKGLLAESLRAREVAAFRAVVRTQLGGFSSAGYEGGSEREIRFLVHHVPRSLEGRPWVEGREVQEGDLRIRIDDPARVPPTPATPNVHYTNPDNLSHRPFTTGWSVRVAGALRLRVETEDRPLLGDAGLEPVVLEDVWRLNFSFSVPAYSGWNLAGVAYHLSNTFGEDLWSWIAQFLHDAWDAIAPIVGWILDGIRSIVRVVMDLLRPLVEFARQVVEFLARVITSQVELLETLVLGPVGVIGALVDAFAALLPEKPSFTVHMLGVEFQVAIGRRPGYELEVCASAGPITGAFAIVDLVDANLARPGVPRYDATVSWDVGMGPFGLRAGFDPLKVFHDDHVFEGVAWWDGAWTMDLAGPSVEQQFLVGASASFAAVVPPFGDVEVTLGIEARFAEDPQVLVDEILERSFGEAEAEVGVPLTWDGIRAYVESFARHLLANSIETLETSIEAAIYLEVKGKAAAVAGGGVRISFTAEGVAVRALLEWLGRNVLAYFETEGFNPLAPVDFRSLLVSAAEHTWLGAQGYFVVEAPAFVRDLVPHAHGRIEVGASIRANVAAIGALFGQDWGPWQVEFEAYLFALMAREGFGAHLPFAYVGTATEVALVRGTLHAL